MELTILGSGLYMPVKGRVASGFYLKIKNKRILVDMGAGVYHRLLQAGIDYASIDYIFITHIHLDHCADLFPFLFGRKEAFAQSAGRLPRVKILVPPGAKKFFQTVLNAQTFKKDVPQLAEFHQLTPGSRRFPFGIVKTVKVPHGEDFTSLAYRFVAGGKSVVFSGDMAFCDQFISFAKEADVLVVEAAASKTGSLNHLDYKTAGIIAARAGVKQLILTHYHPAITRQPYWRAIRRNFKGKIVLAKDLKKLKV